MAERLVKHGQITQTYRHGGADVWDPESDIRYPIDLAASGIECPEIGKHVLYDLLPSGWAVIRRSD